jgi:L-fucose/D-arabinose isomerase
MTLPINLTSGNSASKPGVVYTHAVSGALAQYGRLLHINVGKWDESGDDPEISDGTMISLIDWCYAAVTFSYLKGKRVVVFGHDSMGMETALAHILETRNQFKLEITRLDMKLLADMLNKESYDKNELLKLKAWLFDHARDRIEINNSVEEDNFNKSLALYLIVRDLIGGLGGLGGGFMSQLEWGSDLRGIPLPTADIMESLFNSTFDHNGPKSVIPFATEADTQALLTMLFFTYLSGGNPPLFMDFRKVWESYEIKELAKKINIEIPANSEWFKKGFVDGNNSGSSSFNWAAKPGSDEGEIMKNISFPQVDKNYFPGGGNSVQFLSPGGIEGLAGRLAYSTLNGMFSMVWDEASTVSLPGPLAEAVIRATDYTWPHTLLMPKHANMFEYKHYAPANHLHMTWGLPVARLQYWMDMANVLSVTPWKNMEYGRAGTDRPTPLLYILNGGEKEAKVKLKR